MELFGVNPARKACQYFLLTILVGAVILALPISAGERPVSLIDALFTSTSAVCVTGLVVLDTGKDFSLFGQIVILVLIQLGGLGIMTFTTAIMLMIGTQLSFQDRLGFMGGFTAGSRVKAPQLLRAIIVSTAVVELVGAGVLYFAFRQTFPAGQAMYYGIFHSIAAFCNAGFSPFTNNLEGYANSVIVVLSIAGLIIFGGLGFAVIRDLYDRVRYKKSRLSLHSKLCLATTGILLVVGAVSFFLLEHDNALRGMGPIHAAANALFQSVTPRTAGFNTIPQADLSETSLLLTILLMFIGACPGSTGGGIKTATVAVIVLLLVDRFLGRRGAFAFKRTISADSVARALAVLLLGVLVVLVTFTVLLIVEAPAASPPNHSRFVASLFEVVSAFGTVGLSMGMTPGLTPLGKIILILTMYIGRVGLLTLALALARGPERGEAVYIEEPVMVG